MQETWVQSLGQEDPLEDTMATNSSIFAWRIPWTEEPGRLQSMGVTRVRHDLATEPPTTISSVQFSHSVMSNSLWLHGLQHTRLPCPSPPPITNMLKLMSTKSVMPSNHLILCLPLLPSIFPSIRVFSNESYKYVHSTSKECCLQFHQLLKQNN